MKFFLILTFVTIVSKCSSPIDATANVSNPEVSIAPFPATVGNDSVYKIELKKVSDIPTSINLVTSKGIAGTQDFKSITTVKTIEAGQTSIVVSFPKNNSIINQKTENYTITAFLNSSNSLIFSKEVTPNTRNRVCDMDIWKTKSDQSVLLQLQAPNQFFARVPNSYQNIIVDETQTYQTVDGFGYTLTGGSAQVINTLTTAKKQELLQELFGNNANSISINYLRISIGASDLNASVFSYDDMPNGQIDYALDNFSLAQDNELILLIKEILLINPNIKIMAVPWSAPAWMKTSFTTVGSSLSASYYYPYSLYFVKYIQAMQAQGIPIDALCIQNEPLNGNNNPSMVMPATQQAYFIKYFLGPSFQNEGITTKIVTYDHNCDVPSYPISILDDVVANPFVNGSAFHLYGGTIDALTTVHNAYPNKKVYFTEQWTSSTGDFGGDLKWHTKNVIIGSMRNWSVNALEWNLANNASFGPHTSGGCSQCKGAITINSSTSYTRNVSYYIVGHASKFVTTGSVRIASNVTGYLSSVAFKTPTGSIILIVENDGSNQEYFNIKYNGKWVATSLEAGAVATYKW